MPGGLSRDLDAESLLPVRLDDTVRARLPAPVETTLYYAVAEALTNVARYADASQAIVRLERRDGHVDVEVTDDGRGGASPNGGSGLRALEDRLSTVGGTLELESAPGLGTRVRASVPLP